MLADIGLNVISNVPPSTPHETFVCASTKPVRRKDIPPTLKSIALWPVCPVMFPIFPFTEIVFDATFGKTCTSSIHTGGVLRSSIFPTMPFHVAPSPSEMLCESTRWPAVGSWVRLSTRMLKRCLPGVSTPRSVMCGATRLSFAGNSLSSTQTVLCQCARSRKSVKWRPSQFVGMSMSR